MTNENLECGICGFALGIGVPGSEKWCRTCVKKVIAQAEQGDVNGLIGAGVAFAVGIGIAYALDRFFSGRK